MDQFTQLFYGAMVSQILDDIQDPVETTQVLYKLGTQIGEKMADFYFTLLLLNNQPAEPQTLFINTSASIISYINYVLGVTAQVLTQDDLSYQISVDTNPFEAFVKIPPQLTGLCYSAIIPGAVSGALNSLGWRVKTTFTKQQNYWLLEVKRVNAVLEIQVK